MLNKRAFSLTYSLKNPISFNQVKSAIKNGSLRKANFSALI